MQLNRKFNTYEADHLKLTNLDLAFDVGAYTGDSIVGIRSLGYKKIICFEPDNKNFLTLKSNFGNDLDISCINKAVSNKDDKTVKMYSTRNLPFLNSLEKEWITDTRHLQYYREAQFEEFDVTTITLDTFVKSIGKTPSYVKIDVEGHEKYVLDGMSFKPEILSFEYISERLSDNLECLTRARTLGFTRFSFCLGEDIPNAVAEWCIFNDAYLKFINMSAEDIKNNISGNVFCK